MRTPCPNVRQRTKDAEVIVDWGVRRMVDGGQAEGRTGGKTVGVTLGAGGQADGRTGGKAERRMELLTSRLPAPPPSRPTHAAWAPSAVGGVDGGTGVGAGSGAGSSLVGVTHGTLRAVFHARRSSGFFLNRTR